MDRDISISFNASLTALKNKVQTIAAGTVPVDGASLTLSRLGSAADPEDEPEEIPEEEPEEIPEEEPEAPEEPETRTKK